MILINTKSLSSAFDSLLSLRKLLEDNPNTLGLITSPAYGNEETLKGKIPPKTTVISFIPHVVRADETVDFHKICLGVSEIITLFPATSDYSKIKDFPKAGLYDVTSVEDIESFERINNRLPTIVSFNINPLKYPRKLIKYCENRGIPTIGTEIFGPKHLSGYYQCMFPESFLQAFGEHNTSDIEVPGDPFLIGRVLSRCGGEQENPNILEYSKELDKIPNLAVPKQVIHSSGKIEIPDLGSVSYLGDPGKFSTKPGKIETSLGDPVWEDLEVPEDITGEDQELLGNIHKYHSFLEIDSMYSHKLWRTQYKKIYPNFWAIKIIPRSWMGWFWAEHNYWLISGKLYKMPSGNFEILINGENNNHF